MRHGDLDIFSGGAEQEEVRVRQGSSRREYQKLVESTGVVFRLDQQLRFTFVSAAVDRVFAVDARALIGTSLDAATGVPAAVAHAIERAARDIRGEQVGQVECMVHGRCFRIRIVQDSRRVEYLGVIEEVPATDAGHRAQELALRTLACAASEEVLITSTFTAASAGGAAWLALLVKSGGEPPQYDLFRRGSDGERAHHLVQRAPERGALASPVVDELDLVADGESLGVMYVGFADVAAHAAADRAYFATVANECAAALRRVRSSIAERAATEHAVEASGRLQREAQMLERLLGIVGHDLRNPLAAIVMTVQALAESGAASPAIERIQRSARRMELLIRDILDVTRVRNAGGLPIEPEPCDLAAVIEDQLDEIRRVYPGREFRTLRCRDGAGVWDPARIDELLSNLLGNAARHGGSGPIDVSLDGDEQWIELTITNCGEIPARALSTLFDPFTRGEPNPRGCGLGLGLFICRSIVEAHGGTIRAVSQQGTTSLIARLPRQTPATAIPMTPSET